MNALSHYEVEICMRAICIDETSPATGGYPLARNHHRSVINTNQTIKQSINIRLLYSCQTATIGNDTQ